MRNEAQEDYVLLVPIWLFRLSKYHRSLPADATDDALSHFKVSL